MGSAMLFVHSPLVGPSSLRRLADLAADRGHSVALPDLTTAVGAATPHRALVEGAVGAAARLRGAVTVVGHSGAGTFLPAIGDRLAAAAPLVFVDAVVPRRSGQHATSTELAELLDRNTTDGMLAPWLAWWPAELVASLLPDPADRDLFASDMPRVPRSFYDRPVPVPDGWSDRPCAYVQLSPAYDADRAEAEARGWPTIRLDANHLSVHTAPGRVLDAILDILAWPA